MIIEEIIKEAKIRYPIGTIFHPVSYFNVPDMSQKSKVMGHNFNRWKNYSFPEEMNAITESSGTSGLVYSGGVWAPIVEDNFLIFN